MRWEKKPQSLANHSRIVPPFHYGLFGIGTVNLVWTAVKLVRSPSLDTVVGVLVAVLLIGLLWYARLFPLKVQDRVIRLEMRLRLARLLPPELQARIDELTPGQLVALRFAGDAELPALVVEVLAGRLTGGREIKAAIREWQADYLRV